MGQSAPERIDQLIRAGQLALMRERIDHDPTFVGHMARKYDAEWPSNSPDEFGQELVKMLGQQDASDLFDRAGAAALAGLSIYDWSACVAKGGPAPVRHFPQELWHRADIQAAVASFDAGRPPRYSTRMERAVRAYQRSGLLKRTAAKYKIDRDYLKSVLVELGCYRTHGSHAVSGGLPTLGKRHR